jgi:hypothetical protein
MYNIPNYKRGWPHFKCPFCITGYKMEIRTKFSSLKEAQNYAYSINFKVTDLISGIRFIYKEKKNNCEWCKMFEDGYGCTIHRNKDHYMIKIS